MRRDLFRREVIQAKANSHLGGISLAQPLRLWLLTAFSVLAASLIVGFLVLGEYTRRSRVVGQLVPDLGLSTVTSSATGVVANVLPAEGDAVHAGAALVRIQIPRAMADGQESMEAMREQLDARSASVASLGQSQIAQIDAQIAGTNRQLAAARQELRQIEQAVIVQRQQVGLARAAMERYRAIAGDQYVSQTQVDQQQQAMLEQISTRQALERQATSIRRSIVQMEQALQEFPAQRAAQLAVTERDRALIDQEQIQQQTSGEILVKAPLGGLVASRLVEPGQAVQAGQPLLSLLPEGSTLEAQLLVPSRAVGFIEPGNTVLLRYQAFPYQKFGHQVGHVVRVSRSPVNPDGSAVVGSAQAAEPYYRVLVALDAQTVTAYGKREALRPGMLLDADILSERRKLYEWLLEPLYSLRGAVGS